MTRVLFLHGSRASLDARAGKIIQWEYQYQLGYPMVKKYARISGYHDPYVARIYTPETGVVAKHIEFVNSEYTHGSSYVWITANISEPLPFFLRIYRVNKEGT